VSGFTLDAGALIGFERDDRYVAARIRAALLAGVSIAVPAGVLGQVWRDGSRQAVLAKLLKSPIVKVVVLDGEEARAAGQMCGRAGTADVIDASVVLCARKRGHTVLTSDVDDLLRLDPELDLEEV
jgi:hypothetical protein